MVARDNDFTLKGSRRSFERRALLVSSLGAALPASASAPPSLGAAFASRTPMVGFGFAVTPAQLDDPVQAELIRHHARWLVAENAMKLDSLAPREGQYQWRDADRIAEFAHQHGLRLRGHTLVWHQQAPAWIFEHLGKPAERARVADRLQRLITDVVGHFKGAVACWDVVNEALQVDEGPTQRADAQGLRLSAWRKTLGPDYVALAFRAAAAADPGAQLFYNDYETQNPNKLRLMLKLLARLRTQGVRVDGIGHQMHCAMAWPRAADVQAAVAACHRAGYAQHVTELDVALNDKLDRATLQAATPELLQAQAARYAELARACLASPGAVSALLVWGLSDAGSWLLSWPVKRFEAPLLFDAALQPKPAFHALLQEATRP